MAAVLDERRPSVGLSVERVDERSAGNSKGYDKAGARL